MIVQEPNEPRIEYLARVLDWLMANTPAGECMVDYDGASCDGNCLAIDFLDELNIHVDR